jgi:uncharacterized peroxidase-related enzyme
VPHIKLNNHLPGITGLLEYRLDTALPIRELTEILLRQENSLTRGERELIASLVSSKNECFYCTNAHVTVTNQLLGEEETTNCVIHNDIDSAKISDKMKALLKIAQQVQKSGKEVTKVAIKNAKDCGASDNEIHDTVLIASLFCLYNKYVDGMATIAPKEQEYYNQLGHKIVDFGYNRRPQNLPKIKN